jgi:hypothetical protein
MPKDEIQMTNVASRRFVVRHSGFVIPSLRHLDFVIRHSTMGSEGFEPSKALPSDLQSDPFDHSGNPPR